MPVVVDASALIELLLRNPAADLVGDALGPGEAFAPELLDAEILSAIARLERAAEIPRARAAEVVADLISAPLERWPHLHLANEAWSRRHRFSLYDALYVALAAQLGCGLITADRRLASACAGEVPVTLVPVRDTPG
jgi:predicted nucleic acid-binding protein